jgi:hypothetical protein
MNLPLPVVVTDIFNEWMTKVNVKLSFNVHRYSAHIIEVLENLKQLDSASRSDIKYPVVILICDFEEQIGANKSVELGYQTATLNFIIANTTERNYKQPERLEQNFKPVLYPIYKALLESILESTSVYRATGTLEDIPHTKYDRYFWGREKIFGNDANTFNDYLDAIEIRGMKVKLRFPTCAFNRASGVMPPSPPLLIKAFDYTTDFTLN